MHRIALLMLVLGLVLSCGEPSVQSVVDQCARERVFKDCLSQADGKVGAYEEIVAECDVSSLLMAKRRSGTVREACIQ